MQSFSMAPFSAEDSASQLEDFLEEVISCLGASMNLKSMQTESAGDQGLRTAPSVGALIGTKIDFKCTGLSLKHTSHRELRNKTHAEQYAADLLARPVAAAASRVGPAAVPRNIKALGSRVLTNIYESFATLSESRLRAYGNYLVSQKQETFLNHLEKLFQLGSMVEAVAIRTEFRLLEAEPTMEDGTLNLPLTLRVHMTVLVPELDCTDLQSVTLAWEAPGDVSVSGSAQDGYDIQVNIDTSEFLTVLMKQVSLIIESVVAMAKDAFVLPPKKQTSMKRSGSSFMVMPPPPPCANKLPRPNGLDLLSKAAASRAIVSPDLVVLHGQIQRIPELKLEDDDDSNIDELSIDQCEHIVDDVFGDMDDALLLPPSCKKLKTGP